MTDPERYEAIVYGFIAEMVRLGTGENAAALSASSDGDGTAVVVCENGAVYRVRTVVAITQVDEREEGEVS
jgi:hypothetical protein